MSSLGSAPTVTHLSGEREGCVRPLTSCPQPGGTVARQTMAPSTALLLTACPVPSHPVFARTL